MADCSICGQSAGFLRKVHPECQRRQQQSQNALLTAAAAAAQGQQPLNQLKVQLSNLTASGALPEPAARQTLAQGLQQALEEALEDHLLSPEEEKHLQAFAQHFALNDPAFQRQVKEAALLREIGAGNFPESPSGIPVPFIYQKQEKEVWVFPNIQYAERVTRRERTGTSHGVSIRLAKGLYYSPRTFRSRPVEYQETVHVDTGVMALTTKNLYFGGAERSFRIPYRKIVSLSGYDNGIEIVRDGVRAQPQYFLTENSKGWFMSNLANALTR